MNQSWIFYYNLQRQNDKSSQSVIQWHMKIIIRTISVVLWLFTLQMISDSLGPGKLNKVPAQEAIAMKAFKVQYAIF